MLLNRGYTTPDMVDPSRKAQRAKASVNNNYVEPKAVVR